MATPFDNGYDDGLTGQPNRNPHAATSFSFTDYNAGYANGADDRRCLMATPESLRADERRKQEMEYANS